MTCRSATAAGGAAYRLALVAILSLVARPGRYAVRRGKVDCDGGCSRLLRVGSRSCSLREGAVSIQRPTTQSSGKGSGTRISILKEVSSCGSQAEKLRSATIVPWSEYFCDQGEAAHWLDD
jgi:hypothetical protein